MTLLARDPDTETHPDPHPNPHPILTVNRHPNPRTLDRTIIVLDEKTMVHLRARRSADKTGLAQEEARHHLHSPRSQKLFRQVLNTIGVLVHLEGDADALVLEHVKDSHYNCLVRKGAGYERPKAPSTGKKAHCLTPEQQGCFDELLRMGMEENHARALSTILTMGDAEHKRRRDERGTSAGSKRAKAPSTGKKAHCLTPEQQGCLDQLLRMGMEENLAREAAETCSHSTVTAAAFCLEEETRERVRKDVKVRSPRRTRHHHTHPTCLSP